MKSKINANRALVAEKSKLTKLFTLLAVLLFGIGNAWADTELCSATLNGISSNSNTTGIAQTGCTMKWNSVTYSGSDVITIGTVNFYKFSGSSSYVQLVLTSGSFQAGDELTVTLCSNAGSGKTKSVQYSLHSDSGNKSEAQNVGSASPTDVAYTLVAADIESDGSIKIFRGGNTNIRFGSFSVTRAGGGGGDPVDPVFTYTASTYTIGDPALDLSTKLSSTNTVGAITFAVSTSDAGTTGASIASDKNFTATTAGTATITVSQEASTGYNAHSEDITVTVVEPDPCHKYFYFTKAADATTAGVTNNEGGFFTVSASGSNGTTGSITLDGTTYNCTNRTSNATTLATFTIPANKKGDLYGLLMSSGSSARGLLLDGVSTGVSCEGGTSELHNIEINNIVPGTHTLTADGNTRVGMFIMKVCDATFRTITLEYADGTTPDGSLSVLDGEAATKPADPTWAHHRFAGWYNGASPYDWASTVSGDITLTAHWTQLYTITYAAGDGTATGDAPTQEDKAEGETFSVAANTFTVAGKDFVTWNDGSNDYAPSTTYTVGTDNVILTAQWTTAADKYTVHYMDEDGTTPLGADELVNVGEHPAGITATKPLFTFASWQLSGSDIALSSVSAAKDEEVTLTARWTKAYATSYDMEAYAASVGASKAGLEEELTAAGYAYTNINGIDNGHTHNYTYDGMKYKTNDGDLSFNVVAGKVVEVKTGHLPSNDAVIMNINGVADATVFEGADEASETHKTNYFYSAVEAPYRLDVLASKGTCAVKAVTIRDPFTVSFEAHGDADPSALQGLPSVTLPDATNGTASLLGWFDAETGGNKIGNAGATYIPTANITLHAQWESVSSDNTLSDLKVGGVTVDGFDPAVHTYYVVLPYGTAVGDIPAISATANSAKAKQVAIEQAVWTGDPYNCYRAQANVQAEDESWGYYDVRFSFAPKDGASIFKAELTSATTATYSGIYADADNSQIKLADDGANGYKFSGTSNFIKMALDGGTFATGDLLTMTYSKDPQQGELAIYENTTKIVGTSFANHTLEFTAGADGLTELFIRRTSDNNFNGWVSVVEVTRVVNPMLTAITFAGEAGTINESLKTVTVTVPNATDLGSMTVVPTIVRNAPHATTPEAVITNAGAWVEGPNTYRIMDKDGDYTDYTVTITRAALSTDATLSELTYGGTAIALADGVFEYNVELPYGTSVVPALAATAHHVSATIKEISDAAGFVNRHATSTVTVKAEDNSEQVYTVNFEVSRFESKLIWDGSTMSALSDITAAATAAGVAVTTTGISVTSFSAKTCEENGKSYTKALDFGGKTQSSRNFGIEIPAGKVAKVSLVYRAKSTSRSIMIATALSDAVDESTITSKDAVDASNLYIMTADMFGGGTLYINTTDGFHVHEISIQLAEGYGRSAMLGNGVLGTVCVPNNVAIEDIQGATFYELAGREPEHGKLAFDEITSGELEAGVPYLFQAKGNHIALLYGATHVDNPVDKHNGMYGTFTDITLTELTDVYYFAQKALWGCCDLTSLSVPANRAYVKLSEIDYLSALAPAPGRRRIELNVNGENQATGFENIESGDAPMKVMIDGTLYILRGEKVFDATGRLVK